MSIEFNSLSSSYSTSAIGNNKTLLAKKDVMPAFDKNNSIYEPPLTEAIRLYRNYVLTGVRELTSDEKEEIKGLIEEYMKEKNFLEKYSRNKASKDDYAALNDYIKGLYKQYGSKGDYYEFVTDYVDGMLKEVVNPNPDKPEKQKQKPTKPAKIVEKSR